MLWQLALQPQLLGRMRPRVKGGRSATIGLCPISWIFAKMRVKIRSGCMLGLVSRFTI
jgi:hypothetical protein